MKLDLSPTEEFLFVNGARCRVWRGWTDAGSLVEAYIAAVKVAASTDLTEQSGGVLFETDSPVIGRDT